MIDLNISFVIQLINFMITLFVLNAILVKPIREIIKKRADTMAQALSEAERFSEDAEAKIKNYEHALVEARANATAERNAKKEEGEQQEKSIMAEASADAQKTMQEARKEVAEQVDSALAGLKGQVDQLAQKAADRVLG